MQIHIYCAFDKNRALPLALNFEDLYMNTTKRILIVDDEPIVCKTLEEMLIAFGYQVTVFHFIKRM